MKLISFLAAAAVLGLGVSALDLSFNAYVAAASILVVLGVVRDYSPRHARWEPLPSNATRFPAATVPQPARLAA